MVDDFGDLILLDKPYLDTLDFEIIKEREERIDKSRRRLAEIGWTLQLDRQLDW